MDTQLKQRIVREDLSRLFKSPLVCSGIIIQVLKLWFSENSEQFKFDPNDVDSKIDIDMAYNFRPEKIQTRPGFYVQRENYTPKLEKLGFNDLRFIRAKGDDKSFLSGCSLSIRCTSLEPGECDVMVEQLLCILLFFKEQIRHDFCLLAFEIESVGRIQKHQEYKDAFVVPVVVSMAFTTSVFIKSMGTLPVKRITFNINEECNVPSLSTCNSISTKLPEK